MEQSFLHFKAANPQWQPDMTGSLYLSRLNEIGNKLIERARKDDERDKDTKASGLAPFGLVSIDQSHRIRVCNY